MPNLATDRDPRRSAPLAAVLALGLLGGAASGQEATAPRVEGVWGVRDAARLFDPEAVKAADARLERIEHQTHVAACIETVTRIEGGSIQAAAAKNARLLTRTGTYVLIDRADRKLEIVSTDLDRAQQTAVRDAFLSGFKQRDYNLGLERGLAAIEKAAGEAAPNRPRREGADGPAGGETGKGSALIQRHQVRLTLSGAKAAVAGAEAKAAAMGLKMNVAVVDEGGHLLTFDRMDGARPASGYTAMTKATAAATFRQETGPMPKGTATADVHLGISLQNAAAASGGKLTTLLGGVPVVIDGQVVGAVGVGGGSGEQDAEVARAGVARLLSELRSADGRDESPRREADEKAGRAGEARELDR